MDKDLTFDDGVLFEQVGSVVTFGNKDDFENEQIDIYVFPDGISLEIEHNAYDFLSREQLRQFMLVLEDYANRQFEDDGKKVTLTV